MVSCLVLLVPPAQGTIGSSFFMQVRKIIQSPEQLPSILGAALPDSSNFFMQFIAMRALFLIWLRMCVPHGGVWQNWCHYCFCLSCCCSTCNTGGLMAVTSDTRNGHLAEQLADAHMLDRLHTCLGKSGAKPVTGSCAARAVTRRPLPCGSGFIGADRTETCWTAS